ncbi:MAG: VanW family protein [Actinomycetota bacterium]
MAKRGTFSGLASRRRKAPHKSQAPAAGARMEHLRTQARTRHVRLVVIGTVVVVALAVFDAAAARGRVHHGVEVVGIPLGGRTPAEAEQSLAPAVRELAGREIGFQWSRRAFTTTPSELGWRPDMQATVGAAFEVGRAGPPWTIAWNRATTWIVARSVSWHSDWDLAATRKVVERWSQDVGEPPREGRVWVDGGTIRTSDPAPGRSVDVEQLLAHVDSFVNGEAEPDIALPIISVQPATTRADVDEAAEEAERMISGPVEVRIGRLELTVPASKMGRYLQTRVGSDETDASLEVGFSPARVGHLLKPYDEDFEREPRSAEFVEHGHKVEIKPSAPGRTLDADVAAEGLARIAKSDSRSGRIPLVEKEAPFTTAEAEELGITKKISSFTTYYTPGESRVTNIHLAADIIDGKVVEPGDVFSMNEIIGQRTAERGFVEAPAIYDGAFTTDIGGGISQLATTIFNAGFFGGYPFEEYQAHSFYIDRYPMGREATLHWTHPDLAFRNDTKNPILVATDYTSSSITVSIYGSPQDRRVRATDPVIVDRYPGGYTVLVHRLIEKDGRVVKREDFRTNYVNKLETVTPTPTPTREPKERE